MLNKCMFIGNLGRDPDVKYTPNGVAVANFSIATSESWKDKQTGEKVTKTEWIRCVAFARLAEIVGEYLTKGKQVFIEGKYTTRSWEKDDGNKGYMTEVVVRNMVMLGGGGGGRNSHYTEEDIENGTGGAFGGSTGMEDSNSPMGSGDDDDIPF